MIEGEDAREKYELAKRLYREGQYDEAQELLDDLVLRRPDSKHIMYSRALCLAALGRMQEAHFVHDKLASIGGSTGSKLSQRLHEKFIELQRAKLMEQPDAHRVLLAELSGRSTAQRSSGTLISLVFGAVAILGVAGAAVFLVLSQNQDLLGRAGGADSMISYKGSGPDRFFEPTTFYPAGTQRSLTFAMFLAPPEGETPAADPETCDCVGAAVAADWENVRANAHKAVAMAGSLGEELDGTPRARMVRNAVLPRGDVPVDGSLQERDLQTFSPGSATALGSVAARCGKPGHTEWWVTASRAIGLNGETHWWGNIGVAADADGAITHLLFRAYPASME